MKELDFLPERIMQQRARRARLIRQGHLMALCVLSMAALAYLRQGRIAAARADLREMDRRLAGAQVEVAKIPPLERQLADLLIKKRIDEELGSQTDCTAVLADLARLMPRNVSLVSLELQTVEINLQADEAARRRFAGAAGKTVRRFRLVLSGMAPTDVDVANFIGQLSASPLFEDVNMGYTRTVSYQGRSAREFQASCYLTR